MRYKLFFLLLLLLSGLIVNGQSEEVDEKYYQQIPESPELYTAATVSARLVDGLGFRYYWATEGLKKEDLTYAPSEESRNLEQTIDHILGLVHTSWMAITKEDNDGSFSVDERTFVQKRRETLLLIQEISNILKHPDAEVEHMKIVFVRGERRAEFPFWNLVNGPLSDAMWHTGQLVTLRRAAGNPIMPGVNFMTGTAKLAQN